MVACDKPMRMFCRDVLSGCNSERWGREQLILKHVLSGGCAGSLALTLAATELLHVCLFVNLIRIRG